MEILFEDKDILVCIKPQGIVSQNDAKGASMISILEEHTGGTVYPLHRLDREVGGVMVYAKSRFAAACLSKDIAEHMQFSEKTVLNHIQIIFAKLGVSSKEEFENYMKQ